MKLKTLNQILFAVIIALLVSCGTTEEITSSSSSGTYNGHQLYKGSKGGCYYINSNNNKTYVDASYCN